MNNEKITKELFIESIEKIQEQFEHDKRCSEAFKTILQNDYVTGYDNHYITEQVLKILNKLTNDTDDWIGYYIYDLDFGEKYEKGCIKINGKNIKLKTVEDLWNLLYN